MIFAAPWTFGDGLRLAKRQSCISLCYLGHPERDGRPTFESLYAPSRRRRASGAGKLPLEESLRVEEGAKLVDQLREDPGEADYSEDAPGRMKTDEGAAAGSRGRIDGED